MTTAQNLLLILAGGPTAMLTPLLVARWLVEQHAESTATAIRRTAPTTTDPDPAEGMELAR